MNDSVMHQVIERIIEQNGFITCDWIQRKFKISYKEAQEIIGRLSKEMQE